MENALFHARSLLEEIAAEHSLSPGFRVNLVGGEEGGFHGVIQFVELVDGARILPLVLKLCPKSPLTRELQKTHSKFLNEVAFYRDIASKLEQHGRIPRIPKYYGSRCEESEEVIALEDLRSAGFKMKSLDECLDSKHLDLIASSLGKLHQSSIKWRERDPEDFQNSVKVLQETIFCERTNPIDRELAQSLFVQACEKGLECATPDDRVRGSTYINSMIGRLDELQTWITPNKSEVNVLLHGDSWCHNFLFRYDENNEPVEVAFIDWQMLKFGPPALDLIECFLSSADADAMRAPSHFFESYIQEVDFELDSLKKSFFECGAPALLLVLAILVNFAEKDSLDDKFNAAFEEGKFKNELSESARARIRTMFQTAAEIGLFTKSQ